MKMKPPEMFKPLLWSFAWEKIDIEEDKEDIILNTVNEGTLAHWHWLIKTYGKEVIKKILERHLDSEFHPESRNLAKIIFSLPQLRHTR